ncbi:hypothetical protein [Gemmatimonas groenlandica]|uniref:TonB C-terminal domain-containing protein n=1 Tax=Gemmatimonas groenlandica TaxID=2732249 RepID=A0A6M4IUC7_9BACT|nr:hypothetical protein [Gemmatimonas groenlandica]QJR35761.1 hypothetical protein HKW67_09665 [Gemmatimonas groenlandica]
MKYWPYSVLAAALLITAASAFPDRLSAQVIAGRVTDDRTMKPAVDYVVRLVQMADTGLVALDEATTDTKGQFTVVAPSAGSYVLSFGRTAPRVHRVPVEVAAGVAPAPKDFPLPIQRESDTRPYVDVDVDSVLLLQRGSAGIMYPQAKREAMEGGSLFAMFVVDTTGHVEKNTVRLFSGTHADFTNAVNEWMSKAWFRPPTIGGVLVRRHVCLPLVFRPSTAGRRVVASTPPRIPAAGLSNSARELCARALESNATMTVFTLR